MSRKRKKWLSRMLALCLILALLPINTAYADEVDTQDAVYQTEDIQPAEAAAQPEVKQEAQPEEAQPEAAQPEEQPEEVKPEAQPEEAQPEEVKPEETQPEEVKPEEQPEEVKPEEAQPEEAQPAEAQPEEVQPEAPVEPDQGAAVEEAVEPAEIMLAPAASTEKIKKLELNLNPVTELRYLTDFAPISYSPSDKITLKDAYVYEGYDKKSGSRADSYQFYNAYTAVYEFKTNSPKYSFDIYTSGIKINSQYIKDWSYECGGGDTLKIYVSYPSLEKKVRVTFKSRDHWSDKISSMYVSHNLFCLA